MNADGTDIADELRSGLRRQMWATMLLYVVVIVVSAAAWYAVKVQTDRNTRTFCALRQDLERRVASAEDFLARNPHGIPGITAQQLTKSISDQQRSIVALSGLDCPPAAP